eukprot:2338097-Pleurochrysis_carterae.AAC.1
MRALAPSTGCPFVAPLRVRFRARPLRVDRFRFTRFIARCVNAHGECVRRIGVRLEYTSHVPHLYIAVYAASGTQCERQVSDAGIER